MHHLNCFECILKKAFFKVLYSEDKSALNERAMYKYRVAVVLLQCKQQSNSIP